MGNRFKVEVEVCDVTIALIAMFFAMDAHLKSPII